MPALLKTCLRTCRLMLATLALVGLATLSHPASAQQPNSVNPTASSVKEDQLLEQMRIIRGRARNGSSSSSSPIDTVS